MSRIPSILRAALAAALLAALPARAAPPQVMTYSGYLKSSSGGPVTAATNLTFRLYTASTGGPSVWSETVSVTPSSDGWFSAVIGTTSSLPFGVLNQDLYLSLQVGADPEFALRARVTPSHAALTVDWGGIQGKPTCGPGQYLTLDGAGGLTCSTPAGGGTGGVTSVNGSGFIAASPSTGVVSLSLTGCTAAGQILQWNGVSWQCIATPSGGGFSPPLCATAGQVMQWSGSVWQCGPDATGVTNVTVSGGALSVTPAGTARDIALGAAGVTSSGYLTAADYNAFSGKANAPSAACLPGQVLTWSGAAFQCVADLDTNSGGTVTSVTAAPGPIAVGGTAAAPVVGITQADAAGTSGFVTSADYVAWSGKQNRVTGTCGATQKVLGVNVDGTVTCGTDADTDTTYTAGAGLGLAGAAFSANFTTAGGNNGTATTVARGDHGHTPLATVQLRPPDFQTESVYTPVPTLGRVTLSANSFTWNSVSAWTLQAGGALTATVQVPGGVTSSKTVTAQLVLVGESPTAVATTFALGVMAVASPGTGVLNTWSDYQTRTQTLPAGGTQTVTISNLATDSFKATAVPVVAGDVLVLFLRNTTAAGAGTTFHLLGLQLIFN